MRRGLKSFIPALVYYGLIFFLSSQPNVRLPVAFPWIDKILHIILYAGFGACLAFGWMNNVRPGRSLAPTIGLGAVLAALDEVHQLFVPGRSADLLDFLVDGLGLAAGWWIVRKTAGGATGRRLIGSGRMKKNEPQP